MPADFQNTALEVRRASASSDEEVKAAKNAEREFLSLAMGRWRASSEHEAEMRRDMLDDFKFSIGDQWSPELKTQRMADGRPCLTMDHIDQAIKQITNEQRQQRISPQVNPVGDGATRKVADILQGAIRHVEVISEAEIAYDVAFDHVVRAGKGWILVLPDYLPGDTFDQDVFIRMVKNPFTVYDDPASIEPDGTDADFRFQVVDMPMHEYKRTYKDSEMASLTEFTSIGDMPTEWASKDAVRVADYYWFDYKEKSICLLKDGTVVPEAELTLEQEPFVVRKRTAEVKVVMHSKINGIERLEPDKVIPGDNLPLIPVYGDDLVVDNKRVVRGITRNAKDPQRMYNYQCSAATEQVALAPKAPFIGAKGQFKSGETQWKQLNQRNFPYLEYDPVAVGNTQAPPPQRNAVEPPIMATAKLIQLADNDIKASMGIYDASLGQRGPEQSGRAILARQKQGDIATMHYSDNLARSVRQVGRTIIGQVRVVYDAPRLMRVVNPDMTVRHFGVYNSKAGNKEDYSPESALKYLQGLMPEIEEAFDIGAGQYDIAMSTGPNYNTKRAEAVESIMALVGQYPQLMQVAGDLLVANMDWPYADQIAKRLKKTLPPNLLDEDDKSPEAQVAGLQQKLNELGQQHQLLTQALEQANEVIKTKQVEAQNKERLETIAAELKVRLALIDKETKLAVAEIGTKAQDKIMRDKIVADVFKQVSDHAHELGMSAVAPPEEGAPAPAAEEEAPPAEGQPEAEPSSFAAGGKVIKGGKATVHAGERVLTKKQNDKLEGEGSITVEGAIDSSPEPAGTQHDEIDAIRKQLEGKPQFMPEGEPPAATRQRMDLPTKAT